MGPHDSRITGFNSSKLPGSGQTNFQYITRLVLHNDTPLTGEFACSDEVMTRFWKNTQWTQRANFIEMPTDCPQRDERLGWMGDAQVYVRTASYNADVAAFFTKWLDDLVEAQRELGPYPDYCPYPMGHGAKDQNWGTAWTDAGIICPYTIWQVYGDTRLIEKNWDSMTRFMNWRRQRAADFRGGKDGNTWGDWLNVNEPTPIEFVDAAYFKHDADLMARMARAIGREKEADDYAKLSTNIAAQFAKDYQAPDGTLKVKTQTAHVLALTFGLFPETAGGGIADQLVARIAKNDYRMATGFLGTKPLPVRAFGKRPERSRMPLVSEPPLPVVGLRSRQRRDKCLGALGQLHEGARVQRRRRHAKRRDEQLQPLFIWRGDGMGFSHAGRH